MHSIKTNAVLIYLMFQNRSESKIKLFVDVLIVAARFFVLMCLYYYLFEYNNGEVKGVTFAIAAWSMFMYFTFIMINPRRIARTIQNDIRSGNVEVHFTKPMNYLSYKMSEFVGNSIFGYIVSVVLGSIVMFMYFGLVDHMKSWEFAISFLIVWILSFILSSFIFISVGLIAFWLEDIGPLQWMIDKFVMILGGAFVPIAFFPEYLRLIAIWSPFGASQFITHIAYTTWPQQYLKLFGIQIMWILIFLVILYFLYKNAIKKVSVNGG